MQLFREKWRSHGEFKRQSVRKLGSGRRRVYKPAGLSHRRVGIRSPFLDRQYAFFLPGEANPGKLPAQGLGTDANWLQGHTGAFLELQKFVLPYTLLPRYRESTVARRRLVRYYIY